MLQQVEIDFSEFANFSIFELTKYWKEQIIQDLTIYGEISK